MILGVTKNKTGVDITSKRFGFLEKEALREIMILNRGQKVYDLGSGESFFSVVVSFLGLKVFAIDENFKNFSFFKLKILKKIFGLKKLKIIKRDISKLDYKDFEGDISIVYSARFFHYLDYAEGKKLLKIVSKKLNKDGKIFFSISGLNADLAKGYGGREVDIEKRFFKISKDLQERFEIKKKVCLYSKKEIEKLFSEFFEIQQI
jgi:cyclopropane fatty-acyl-phospholipid synthase-like methyltransferase